MRFKIGNGLLPLNLIAVVLVIIVIWTPDNVATVILSLPFLLFSPGYSLMLALYPGTQRFDGMGRVVLSLALSVALVAIVGLILDYTPWGISVKSVLFSLLCLIFAFSLVAWIRKRRFLKQEIQFLRSERSSPGLISTLPMRNLLDKALYVLLGITILSTIGAFAYLVSTSPGEEKYTEFYFLDTSSQTNNQPQVFKEGEASQVTVGIYNQNQESVSFGIAVNIDGIKNNELSGLALADKESLEIPVDFTPVRSGDNQKVEFILYDMTSEQVFQTIFLMIDVN